MDRQFRLTFCNELLALLAGDGGLALLTLAVYVSGVRESGVQRPFREEARESAPGVDAARKRAERGRISSGRKEVRIDNRLEARRGHAKSADR